MQEPDKKQFKPGFLSSLNRSFRVRLTSTEWHEKSKNRSLDLNIIHPVDLMDLQPNEGNFRRCHSINVNRKHANLGKIPEMPLGSDLLKKVWKEGLDTVSSSSKEEEMSKPIYSEISTPRIDSYRFSMANLEDSQEVDLDAILSELTALESKCDEEMRRNSYPSSVISNNTKIDLNNSSCGTTNNTHAIMALHRTDSPDNDSAFSDTVSMLSSESSASSSLCAAKMHGLHPNLRQDASSLAKAEKIRLALEKMKRASIKKLFIKAFSVDGSSKSLLVDEKMTCGYVTRLLAEKNHVPMDSKWVIIEYLPELHMERIFEDHEILVDNLMLWARDSKNKILFTERPEKVSIFQQPEKYLSDNKDQSDYDEHSRSLLIEDFFSRTLPTKLQQAVVYKTDDENIAHNSTQFEGPLYLKSDAKKGWKKYNFILKPTGLYYYPKEKSKIKEMVCLASFAVNDLYVGINWKKKHKAPTDFCFTLKHPRLQQPKCVKYIKFLCAEDKLTFDRWIMAIRIAKHGRQLLDNYRMLSDDLAQDDLDQLAHARSCSVISIAPTDTNTMLNSSDNADSDLQNKSIYNEGSITGSSDVSSGRHSCTSSSSSSGCMSDGPSENDTTAFDSEFSTGTIKRKPSMKPNIPLTTMTRQLKEMADSSLYSNSSNDSSNLSGYTNTGTLTRRGNNRKSTQSNEDNTSGSGTLKRHKVKTNRGSIESVTSQNTDGSALPIYANKCNGKQSPIKTPPQYYNEPDVIQSSGIIMGYVTHQTVIPRNFNDTYSTIYGHRKAELNDETIQNLPLPPPPNFTDYDPMFSSTLSLESLPPPPPPDVQSLNGFDLSASQLSLPPPPTPSEIDEARDLPKIYDDVKPIDQSDVYANRRLYANHASSPVVLRKPLQSDDPKSPGVRRKQVSFNDVSPVAQNKKKVNFNSVCIPVDVAAKPTPPKRNETTKLTSPKKLSDSTSNPPIEFIKDLQRVMRKKWQVAQKCKLEPATTPHEVLGFREYPALSEDYKEANVSNWVQEHYGPSGHAVQAFNFYENVKREGEYGATLYSAPYGHTPDGVKKKPPPPIPKRSENTQLSVKPN